jgi:Protein of unknown function (DUF2934)
LFYSIDSLLVTLNGNRYKIEIDGLRLRFLTMERAVGKEKAMPKVKSGSPKTTKNPKKATVPPGYDDIALRAYHIYLERGRTPGDPMLDWLQAERELSAQASKPRRKSKIVSIAA